MFYFFSKLFWIVFQPLSVIFVALLVGAVLSATRLRRTRTLILLAGTVFAFLAVFTNLGEVLISPLEQRYERPNAIPPDVMGAIVLGGAVDARLARVYEDYELNAAGDRLLEALRLAQTDPRLRILVTGGVGELNQDGDGDGVAAQRMFKAFGVNNDRLMFETRSRTTYENGINSRALLGADAKKPWLLVTSAFHMPRSVKVFTKLGFNVIPWPVDYRAPPAPVLGVDFEKGATQISTFTLAIHEWAGLGAYWLGGKTASFWP